MPKQTPTKQVLFASTLRHPVSRVFAVVLTLLVVVTASPVSPKGLLRHFLPSQPVATAATTNTLNFQARLQNAAGAIVADGTYNIEFNLYTASSGGSSLWTEDYLNSASQGVTVKNGYVTVNLGSITAFPSTINWDQNLYLGMTVRGTGSCTFGTCTPTDAEMTPRLQLTASAYAFKANQLAQYDSGTTFTSTLKLAATTTGGNQIFQIQDQGAAGTYNLLTQTQSDSRYIQNQNASAQTTSNYWISGTGKANLFNSVTGYQFNGTAGSTVTCSGGNVLQNAVLQGGIITGGTCVANGGGIAPTLNDAYTNSGASPIINLTATGHGILVRDASTTVGGNLFAVQDNTGGTSYLAVTTAGAAVSGTLTATTVNANAIQTNGTQRIDSTGALSNIASIAGTAALSITSNTSNAITLDSGTTGGVNVGTGANAKTIQIGTTAINTGNTQTIGVGNLNAAGTTNVTVGTGTSATAGTTTVQGKTSVLIGNATTPTITLQAAAAGTINVGTNAVADTVQIGTTAVNTGNTQSINIGNLAAAGTTNVTIGTTTGATAGTTTVQGVTSLLLGNATTPTITLQTAASGIINIGTNAVANTVQIGATTGTAAQVINIGNNATLSSSTTVAIGSTIGSSGTTIQAGSSGITLTGAVTGNSTIQGTRFISTVTTGTAPFTVASTTVVTNLNADLLDGLSSAAFQPAGSYLTSEADTLATVTGRGATTATASSFTGGATIRGLTVDTATATQDRILVTAAAVGAARFDGTITNADLTVARTWTLPDASGTFITTGNLTGITTVGTVTSGIWNGTAVGVAYGGTGFTSYATGDLLYASGASTLSKLADVASGSCLVSGGVGVAPSWGSCSVPAGANINLSNLSAVNIGTTALNSTSNNLNLTTTTSGNIVLNSAGTVELQDNTNVTGTLVASSTVQGTRLISTVATGTAPLTVASTTVVTNLNADLLDGLDSTAFAAASSLGGYVQLQGATPGTAQTGNINVSGTIIAGTFSGGGAGLTNLNASNLSSGTVASSLISGSYTGITAVGTLTSLAVSGAITGATLDTGQGANELYSPSYYAQQQSATPLTSTDDLNSLADGWYRWNSSAPINAPNTYMILVQQSDGAQKIQTAYGHTGFGEMYVRRADTGTFYAWTEFWSAANDGSGSGMNADLLDGHDTSYFSTASGNGNYIQNTTSPQTADFNISGNGTVGGNLQVGGNILMGGTTAIEQAGGYLRLNQSNQFSNGIWLGSSALRAGFGGVYLGSSGADGQIAFLTSTDNTRRITLQGNTGDITASGILTMQGSTIQLSNFYKEYRWNQVNNGSDLNWKKVADVTIGTGIYQAASFQVDVLSANCNWGCSSFGIPLRFYVMAARSGSVQDDTNYGSVAGPSTDYVRLVKTATGVYEIQVRNPNANMSTDFTIRQMSGNGTVSYISSPGNGSTTGTIYTSALGGYTQNLPALYVANVATIGVNLTVNGDYSSSSGNITLSNGSITVSNGTVYGAAVSAGSSLLTGFTQRLDSSGNLVNINSIGAPSNTALTIYGGQSGGSNITLNGSGYTLQNLTTGAGAGSICSTAGGALRYLSGTGNCGSSSIAFKENVASLDDSLNILGQLRPVSFDWKASSGETNAAGGSHDFGLIAQEVLPILPQLVNYDADGTIHGLNYTAFTPFMIRGIQQQQGEISNLQGSYASLTTQTSSNSTSLSTQQSQIDGIQNTLGTISGQLSTGSFDNISAGGNLSVSGTATISTLTVTGSTTLQGTLLARDAEFDGVLTINGHIVTAGNAPLIAVGEALGNGTANQANTDPLAVVDGTDNAGTVSLTTGNTGYTNGVLAHISFAQAYNSSYKAVISASNDNATDLRVYIVKTLTGFDIVTKDTPQAGMNYQFDYIVLGAQQVASN